MVVIGGGDTGADCVGNALREGARSIVQLELLPEPPPQRPDDRTPWPQWPLKYRLSYAMEEAQRARSGRAGLLGRDGPLRGRRRRGRGGAADRPGRAGAARSRRWRAPRSELPAQLVLLAMGFLGPEQALLDQLGVEQDAARERQGGQAVHDVCRGVFAAGDARRGQSLIVWAINEGRQCARMVDRYLAGRLNGNGASVEKLPEDDGTAGHEDADSGPEGPPQHVGPGIEAG